MNSGNQAVRLNTSNTNARPSEVNILLITNGHSDNVGDHVIEACDVALIRTAIKNLGLSQDNLVINSKDTSIIPNAYCDTEDESLLKRAYKAVGDATFVLFGGAPVFNYAYKVFYKKTATVLRIAAELHKPVLFSAIGIESYEKDNPKCKFLKSELHNGTVKQITTRDGIELLEQYASCGASGESPAFPIGLVSDPAVFTQPIFRAFTKTQDDSSVPKIGIFVFRAGGFTDNGIKFGRDRQCQLWASLIDEITARGYDYEILTSGHFADEAALKYMIDKGIVKSKKCVPVLNIPEELVARISSYKAVVSCRLHPSIISFSCNVPSVGLVWNSKVSDFYRHIGYSERAIQVSNISNPSTLAKNTMKALENAIEAGVQKNQNYVESVYATLLDGMAKCLEVSPDSYSAFSGSVLLDNLYTYPGTSLEEERNKVTRKLSRAYRKYNENLDKINSLKSGNAPFKIRYHSGALFTTVDPAYEFENTYVQKLSSGNLEFEHPKSIRNDGHTPLEKCPFLRKRKKFSGWRVRVRINKKWYWILPNGGLLPKTFSSRDNAALIRAGECIPQIPSCPVELMVAEAIWKK